MNIKLFLCIMAIGALVGASHVSAMELGASAQPAATAAAATDAADSAAPAAQICPLCHQSLTAQAPDSATGDDFDDRLNHIDSLATTRGNDTYAPTCPDTFHTRCLMLQLSSDASQCPGCHIPVGGADGLTCGICHDGLTDHSHGAPIAGSPNSQCKKHLYHTDCLRGWQQINNTCPECREPGWGWRPRRSRDDLAGWINFLSQAAVDAGGIGDLARFNLRQTYRPLGRLNDRTYDELDFSTRFLRGGLRGITDAAMTALRDNPNYANLRIINLSGNSLVYLPDALMHFPRLEELDISSNPSLEDEGLPAGPWDLGALRIFNACATGLRHVPPALCNLPSLEHLNLALTRIAALPGDWGVPRLRQLCLYSLQRLRHLPVALAQLNRLELLACSGSGLEDLPEGPWRSPRMRIHLGGTQIHSIPQAFRHLQDLDTLDVSNTPFSRTQDWVDVCNGINRAIHWAPRFLGCRPDLIPLPEGARVVGIPPAVARAYVIIVVPVTLVLVLWAMNRAFALLVAR